MVDGGQFMENRSETCRASGDEPGDIHIQLRLRCQATPKKTCDVILTYFHALESAKTFVAAQLIYSPVSFVHMEHLP